MTRWLLINPPLRLDDLGRHPPHGLLAVAAYLRERGQSAELIDVDADRKPPERVREMVRAKAKSADVVGIGGLVTAYGYVKNVLNPILREECPDLPVVVGGYLGDTASELLLENGICDVAVRGEGEVTAAELGEWIEGKRALASVAGVMYRRGSRADRGAGGLSMLAEGGLHFTGNRELVEELDTLPMPAYDLIPWLDETYYTRAVVAPPGVADASVVSSSRGCPFACAFCKASVYGRTFRRQSVAHFMEELDYLAERHGREWFSMQDNLFLVDRRWCKEFCEHLIANKYDFAWSCTARTDTIRRELVDLMKRSGCKSISFGVESLSQPVLDSMHKGTKVETSMAAIRMVREAGLMNPCSFILGYPGETRETAAETLARVKELGIPLTGLFFATPFPRTPLYELALPKIKALFGTEDAFLCQIGNCSDYVINLTAMSDEEILVLRKSMVDDAMAHYAATAPERTLEEHNARLRGLYGDRLFAKIVAAVPDEKFAHHRRLHGFNEFLPAPTPVSLE